MLTLAFIPITLVLIFSKPILIAIGQDEAVSGYAKNYVLIYIPALYLFGLIDGQRRFLTSLKKTFVPMLV